MTLISSEIAEIAKHLKQLHISHPAADDAKTGFDWIMNYGRLGRSSSAMLLSGPPGSGKTSTVHSWMAGYQPIRGAQADERPVAYAKITGGSVTYRSIAMDLLNAFQEDPIIVRRDTQQTLRQRIAYYARVLKTSVLFVDEAQLIVSSHNQKVIREITEWLKTLLNDVESGFVFCGSDGFTDLFKTNTSLHRRCRVAVEMAPYGRRSEEYASFLATWEHHATVLKPIGLPDPYWSHRLHVATDGFIGITADLLCDAAIHALEHGAGAIRLEDLAAVHERRFPGSTLKKTNPFLPESGAR
ncbi:TniB family NTP-binding protein [Nitrospirillum sp. BR 11164]|uniref:ATP-binding protein n=1 Tax=Nitrospirillum sp. BR 11164 TaxID=3104324 RepID=UPI002AFECA4F|nr:TniB family NTP-binding protein [Nitrospirillum sp. BR 11164]MEA1648795.1 TniB family NTP-binding protein [Nitrospirillum sp. BR 11164]